MTKVNLLSLSSFFSDNIRTMSVFPFTDATRKAVSPQRAFASISAPLNDFTVNLDAKKYL